MSWLSQVLPKCRGRLYFRSILLILRALSLPLVLHPEFPQPVSTRPSSRTSRCEPKKSPHQIFKWSATPWERLKTETKEFAETFLQCFAAYTGDSTISEMWDAIDKHVQGMKKLIPSKLAKPCTDQPWLSPSLKRQCNRCKRKFKKWKTLKGKPCKNAREDYKKAQMEKNKLLRKARLGYINTFLEDALAS